MLERLPGVDGLAATPEQAEKLVAAIRGKMSVSPTLTCLSTTSGNSRRQGPISHLDHRRPRGRQAPLYESGAEPGRKDQRSQRAAVRQPGRTAVCRTLPGEPRQPADPHCSGLPSPANRADGGLRRDLERGCARLAADSSEARDHARLDAQHRRLFGGPLGRRHARRASRRTCEPTTLREAWPAGPCSWDRTAASPSGSRACRTRSSSIDTG